MLHGRQRNLLRKQISAHAANLETFQAYGRIGRVIKSMLQEDVNTFTLESFTVPGEGIITDHREIHNGYFTQWYKGPEGRWFHGLRCLRTARGSSVTNSAAVYPPTSAASYCCSVATLHNF